MSIVLLDPTVESAAALLAWPELQRMERQLGLSMACQNGDFEYKCNFQGFRPSDIKVHHQGDHIVIEAESKLSGRHEHYERSLKRTVKLPNNVDKENATCEMNEKGEIVVRAPKLAAVGQAQKRSIPIIFKKSDQSK